MIKFLTILLLSINTWGQSLISASYLSGEDESTQSSISASTTFLKDGTFSIDFNSTKFNDDEEDETIENKSGALSVDYITNKYLTIGIGGARSTEGEYLETRASNAFVSVNLNHLWDSLYTTSIELAHGRENYAYTKEFTNNTVQRDLEQYSNTLSLSQEFTLWFSMSLSYTQFSYTEDPKEFIDNFPVLLNFVPEFESLLYSFPQNSRSIVFSFTYDTYALNLMNTNTLNLVTQTDELTRGLNLTKGFSSYDLTLNAFNIILEDESFRQFGADFTYYF